MKCYLSEKEMSDSDLVYLESDYEVLIKKASKKTGRPAEYQVKKIEVYLDKRIYFGNTLDKIKDAILAKDSEKPNYMRGIKIPKRQPKLDWLL